MKAKGNATMNPIIQLLSHMEKKLCTNPAFTVVITNDMQKDIINAMVNAVKIRFLFIFIPYQQSSCLLFRSDSLMRYLLTILTAQTSPHMEHPSSSLVHPLDL
jgi:hypothetical protein